MSMILDVLSQRKNDNIIHLSNQEIIGIEIRRKRLELSYTLQGLCFDICSPSYLCKIERTFTFLIEECSNDLINDKSKKYVHKVNKKKEIKVDK